MLAAALQAQRLQPAAECWNALSELPVADRTVYGYVFEPQNVYINISKPKRTLYVYEQRCTGLSLIAAYPVCLGANSGDKERRGDCRTPESKEATIKARASASTAAPATATACRAAAAKAASGCATKTSSTLKKTTHL